MKIKNKAKERDGYLCIPFIFLRKQLIFIECVYINTRSQNRKNKTPVGKKRMQAAFITST